jgi:hypothetical protein
LQITLAICRINTQSTLPLPLALSATPTRISLSTTASDARLPFRPVSRRLHRYTRSSDQRVRSWEVEEFGVRRQASPPGRCGGVAVPDGLYRVTWSCRAAYRDISATRAG